MLKGSLTYQGLKFLSDPIFMCSKRFLNSPPCIPKICEFSSSLVLPSICRDQDPLCALVFLSMVDGYGLPHPGVSLLQSPVRGLVSWYKCIKPFFFLEFYSLFLLLVLCRRGGASCLEKAYLFSLASVYYCEDGLEHQLRGPMKW